MVKLNKTPRRKPIAVEVQPGETRPVGRPPMPYDPFVGNVLLDEIREGSRSIRAILDSRPDFYPSKATLWKWLRENKDFAEEYAKAKEDQQHAFVEDTIHIADAVTKPEEIGIANLRINARRWSAEKLAAKTYGRQPDGPAVVVNNGLGSLMEKMTPQERGVLRALLESVMSRPDPEPDPKQIEGVVRRTA